MNSQKGSTMNSCMQIDIATYGMLEIRSELRL